MQIGPRQIAGTEHTSAEVGTLQIGILPVAGVEFAIPEASIAELCIAHVPVASQHILPVRGRAEKAGQPAVDELHPDKLNAMRPNVGQIAACQPDVLPDDSSKTGLPQLDVLQQRALNPEAARLKAPGGSVMDVLVLDEDRVAVCEQSTRWLLVEL